MERCSDRREPFAETLRPGPVAAEQAGTDQVKPPEAKRTQIIFGLALGTEIEIAALRGGADRADGDHMRRAAGFRTARCG